VKVCDFGIAHWEMTPGGDIDDEDVTIVNRPDASKVVGTPLYMAPEQIKNEKVDARTDVYALGVGPLPARDRPPPVRLRAHARGAEDAPAGSGARRRRRSTRACTAGSSASSCAPSRRTPTIVT